MRSAAIIISGCLAMANADCGWTSTCGPRGCPDCKDDGSAGYRECCGGPSPPPSGPTPPPSPPPPPPPGCEGKTPVDCHGALKKQGSHVVDQNGNKVKLNGLSFFWSNWAGSYWNADTVKFVASEWNVNLVRCPVGVSNSGGDVGGGYNQDPNGNKNLLTAVVDAAIEQGIYAIIDWHVEGRCNADQSKPFFAEMAQKYGNKPNVMWETCNEPTGWSWGAGLKSYHEQVIPVIRQHSSNLIIAGTNTWSQDVDEAAGDPLSDSNVAYTLHFYSSMHKQGNRDKASTAMSRGAAIFVTEWGVEQNGEGNAETNTWMSFLEQNSISSAMWGIYDKGSEAWAIVHGGKSHGGWSDGDLTGSGHFIKSYCQSHNPAVHPAPAPHPTPAPAPPVPTPMPPPPPTPGPPVPPGCPHGSLAACIGVCPSDPTMFQPCAKECQKRCDWTPTPHPTPATPPPTPPPSPASGCPGGSLGACIGLCPADAKLFQACVTQCKVRCDSHPTPPPTPAPTPAPVPTPSGCPGGSLEGCIALCPADPTLFQACVGVCRKRCDSESVLV